MDENKINLPPQTPEEKNSLKEHIEKSDHAESVDFVLNALGDDAAGLDVDTLIERVEQTVNELSEEMDADQAQKIALKNIQKEFKLGDYKEEVAQKDIEDSEEDEGVNREQAPEEIQEGFLKPDEKLDEIDRFTDALEKRKNDLGVEDTDENRKGDTERTDQIHKSVASTADEIYDSPNNGNQEQSSTETGGLEREQSNVGSAGEKEEKNTEDKSKSEGKIPNLNRVPHRKTILGETSTWVAPEGLNKNDFNKMYPLGPNEKERADAFWSHIEELRKKHGYDRAMEIIGEKYRLGGENVEALANRMNENIKIKFPEKTIDINRSVKEVQEEMLSLFFLMTPYMKDREITMPERAAAYAAISADKKYQEYEEKKKEILTSELARLRRIKKESSPDIQEKITELKSLKTFHKNHEMFGELGKSIVRFNDSQEKLNKLGSRPIRNRLPFTGMEFFAANKELRLSQMLFDIQNHSRWVDKQDWKDAKKFDIKKGYEFDRRMWNGVQNFTSDAYSGAFVTAGAGWIFEKTLKITDSVLNWLRKQWEGQFGKGADMGSLGGIWKVLTNGMKGAIKDSKPKSK